MLLHRTSTFSLAVIPCLSFTAPCFHPLPAPPTPHPPLPVPSLTALPSPCPALHPLVATVFLFSWVLSRHKASAWASPTGDTGRQRGTMRNNGGTENRPRKVPKARDRCQGGTVDNGPQRGTTGTTEKSGTNGNKGPGQRPGEGDNGGQLKTTEDNGGQRGQEIGHGKARDKGQEGPRGTTVAQKIGHRRNQRPRTKAKR